MVFSVICPTYNREHIEGKIGIPFNTLDILNDEDKKRFNVQMLTTIYREKPYV